MCANFVDELDDVWLGSGNRPGAVVPPSWFKFGEFRQNPASDKKFRQNLSKFWPKSSEILTNSAKIGKNLAKFSAIFKQKIELRTRFFSPHGFPGFWDSIPKRCKGVHCVDLGESFPTHIFLQNLASIQQRTSLVKFLVRKSFSVVVRQQAERLVNLID